MRATRITIPLLLFATLLFSKCQRDATVGPDTAKSNESTGSGGFEVTIDEALSVAGKHYELSAAGKRQAKSGRQGTTAADPFAPKAREIDNTKSIKDGDETLIHVVNYKDQKGFTLVAADKRYTPVLAFSDDGSFGNDTLPGVRDWLEIVKQSIRKVKKERKEQGPEEKALWARYLKSTKSARSANEECPTCDYSENFSTGRLTHNIAQYSQGSGYGFYAPGDGGCDCTRKPAGCGPVAMAIVMRYHRHPDVMMTFNGESMMLDDAGYEAMPRTRAEAGWDCGRPNDNLRRLAMLLRLNGSAASSGYGVFGNCSTWTIPGNINNGLSFMGFSNGGTWSDLRYSHWQTVMRELRQGFPVIFTGTKCGTCAGSAHIWVADGYTRSTWEYQDSGYDEYGYYYCYCSRSTTEWVSMNWGWGGQNNGEYLAYYNNFDGYDKYLRALVNIRP